MWVSQDGGRQAAARRLCICAGYVITRKRRGSVRPSPTLPTSPTSLTTPPGLLTRIARTDVKVP